MERVLAQQLPRCSHAANSPQDQSLRVHTAFAAFSLVLGMLFVALGWPGATKQTVFPAGAIAMLFGAFPVLVYALVIR